MAKQAGPIPRLPASLGRCKPLFASADVSQLVDRWTMGISPLKSIDSAILAIALSDAFFTGAVLEDWRREPSPSDLKGYFSEIAKLATQLLERLGIEPEHVRILMNDPKLLPRDVRTASGLTCLEREMVMMPATWLTEKECQCRLQNPSSPLYQGHARDDVFCLIKEVPRVLSSLVNVAEWAAQIQPRSQPGRRVEIGREAIFRSLAGVYYATFGERPPIGSDRANEDQTSLRWTRMVLGIANARIADRILLNDRSNDRHEHVEATPLVRLIRACHALTLPTLADRMAEGWKAWEALSEGDRWPPVVWHPFGYTPGTSMVPKWLLNGRY